MSVETEMYPAQLPTDFENDSFQPLPAISKPAAPKPKRRYSHDNHYFGNHHHSHSSASASAAAAAYGLPTAPICRYFALNRCFAGPNCRFTHIVNHGGYIIMYPTLATTGLMSAAPPSPPAVAGYPAMTMSPMSPMGPAMAAMPGPQPMMPMYPGAVPNNGVTYENNSNPDENVAAGEVLRDENGKELCRYYRQGKCFMGAKCRFAHF